MNSNFEYQPHSQAKSPDPNVYELISGNGSPMGEKAGKSDGFPWIREILSLIASLLLIGVQIGLLVYMDGKPYYETWRPFLSLNTALAILTTAYKTAQLHAVGAAIGQVKWIDFRDRQQRLSNFEIYDESSRGPLGAISFLFSVRWGVATLGALVTLLALANDPFTQQVVHLEQRNVTFPDNAALFGHSYEYDTHPEQTGLSWYTYPEISTKDPGIQGAIMKGIFNIQTAPEFVCSGACSWNGTYRSLGFSSTCANVTQAAMATKTCNQTSFSEQLCNYTTPGGVHLGTDYVLTDSSTVLRVAVNDSFFPALGDPDMLVNGTLQGAGPFAPDFLRVGVFRSSSGPDSGFNDKEIVGQDITECAVSLALHTYGGVRANGSALTVADHQIHPLGGGYMAGFTGAAGLNATLEFNATADGAPIDPPLRVGLYDMSSVVLFFESEAFTSHIISGAGSSSQTGIGDAFIKADLPRTFDALAESMTDYVRSLASGPNTRKATGSRVELTVFVRVRWVWMALPLVEELAALFFVLWVVVSNSRHAIPAWKSSALAALTHRYDPASGSLVPEGHSPKEVAKMAKKVDVQLR
ncbi:hypothetical protein F4780DRAFT_513560 [Xylariomycetidae sp. FL0641]|nr:hypothetical protein F4780DRAFT_513560 [Xylariomycetidae sp. FL0641]